MHLCLTCTVYECYIINAMNFRFVPSDPCTLKSYRVVISKQDSTIRAVGYNRCVTGRIPCDGNHTVRFRQSAENHCRAGDTQPIRGISEELARG